MKLLPVRSCLVVVALVLLVVKISGCALMEESAVFGLKKYAEKQTVNKLPAIPVSHDAMQVEIVFIERPATDPLLGSTLWNEVDEIGAIELMDQENLNQNGLRVGHVSSVPPMALQTLLGLKSHLGGLSREDESLLLSGRRLMLRSGVPTDIQTSDFYPKCRLKLLTGDDEEPEEVKEFEEARCVMRVKAHKVQDGWAKLEFTPEVHYGPQQLRRTPTNIGWQLENRQNTSPFYNQKFEVTLNVGEMAIITATDGVKPNSAGHLFFRGEGSKADIQKILVVRLSNMSKMDVVRSE
ncbi:hypothetical protein [Gimesia maris]|uniref:Uncharacterized protein n=1 Tax=Gimesia maris TaxID=122 RepID=A0ABX5YHQ0_9PLAN|nr:hypothetical protein [Gimesia maris]EDL59459.1 2-C-methyl-D-erythritol 2,4-cyclodiphosphate synthase [Gimesia maris DSM 8797]QDU13257.1 hypothetical protein CA11_10390 [Gimesia maris]QEG15189.1 hypothetical protein GmarT_10270 [Gimesia maris]QGQ31470.1 hypothetical protein F1729_24130 [Gimesia maris]